MSEKLSDERIAEIVDYNYDYAYPTDIPDILNEYLIMAKEIQERRACDQSKNAVRGKP